MSRKTTAFVTHSDCSRHDTGWGHPDHQGRLPALTRAVYRDMIDLHELLLDLEGRHATQEELLLFHTPDYLDRLRGWVAQAVAAGSPIEPVVDVRISAATWDAATAAAGSVLVAASVVSDGTVTNAFAAVRPPGSLAAPDEPRAGSIINSTAVLIRLLTARESRVALVELGGAAPTETARAFADTPSVQLVSAPFSIQDADSDLSPSGTADEWVGRVGRSIQTLRDPDRSPDFVVATVDFDGAGEGLTVDRFAAMHEALRGVVDFADAESGGRLVVVLEGGSEPAALGDGTVQILRSLAGLPPKR